MTFQGAFREFIVETTLWRRLYPGGAVGRADRLWFESPLPTPRASSLPSLQHGFDKSLSLVGTPDFLPNDWLWHLSVPCSLVSGLYERQRLCPHRLRMNLPHCSHCLHLFIMCSCVQSETRHSAGETEVADATAPVPAGRGDTAPCKATFKTLPPSPEGLHSSPPTACARPATAHSCGHH